jgi:hypothetical protein
MAVYVIFRNLIRFKRNKQSGADFSNRGERSDTGIMIVSKAAGSFWRCYASLPEKIQKLAHKNYQLWLSNPHHPSLHFKPFVGNDWSVRVGAHYRATGYFSDDRTFVWTWIGTHEDYNNL